MKLTKLMVSYMELSINGGTPKSSNLKGFSLINHLLGSTPIYGKKTICCWYFIFVNTHCSHHESIQVHLLESKLGGAVACAREEARVRRGSFVWFFFCGSLRSWYAFFLLMMLMLHPDFFWYLGNCRCFVSSLEFWWLLSDEWFVFPEDGSRTAWVAPKIWFGVRHFQWNVGYEGLGVSAGGRFGVGDSLGPRSLP